jgi:hypothetical protein
MISRVSRYFRDVSGNLDNVSDETAADSTALGSVSASDRIRENLSFAAVLASAPRSEARSIDRDSAAIRSSERVSPFPLDCAIEKVHKSVREDRLIASVLINAFIGGGVLFRNLVFGSSAGAAVAGL